jgi:hypothetical protein
LDKRGTPAQPCVQKQTTGYVSWFYVHEQMLLPHQRFVQLNIRLASVPHQTCRPAIEQHPVPEKKNHPKK